VAWCEGWCRVAWGGGMVRRVVSHCVGWHGAKGGVAWRGVFGSQRRVA
jgi:hypothetical protein